MTWGALSSWRQTLATCCGMEPSSARASLGQQGPGMVSSALSWVSQNGPQDQRASELLSGDDGLYRDHSWSLWGPQGLGHCQEGALLLPWFPAEPYLKQPIFCPNSLGPTLSPAPLNCATPRGEPGSSQAERRPWHYEEGAVFCRPWHQPRIKRHARPGQSRRLLSASQ